MLELKQNKDIVYNSDKMVESKHKPFNPYSCIYNNYNSNKNTQTVNKPTGNPPINGYENVISIAPEDLSIGQVAWGFSRVHNKWFKGQVSEIREDMSYAKIRLEFNKTNPNFDRNVGDYIYSGIVVKQISEIPTGETFVNMT